MNPLSDAHLELLEEVSSGDLPSLETLSDALSLEHSSLLLLTLSASPHASLLPSPLSASAQASFARFALLWLLEDSQGFRAVHVAASLGLERVLAWLCSAAVVPAPLLPLLPSLSCAPNRSGNTPFMFACKGGHAAACKLLLRAALPAVDPALRCNAQGDSPLQFALADQNLPVVDLLLLSPETPPSADILPSSETLPPPAAPPSADDPPSSRDVRALVLHRNKLGLNAPMIAASRGAWRCLERLLAVLGAGDPGWVLHASSDGSSLLHFAVRSHSMPTLHAVLRHLSLHCPHALQLRCLHLRDHSGRKPQAFMPQDPALSRILQPVLAKYLAALAAEAKQSESTLLSLSSSTTSSPSTSSSTSTSKSSPSTAPSQRQSKSITSASSTSLSSPPASNPSSSHLPTEKLVTTPLPIPESAKSRKKPTRSTTSRSTTSLSTHLTASSSNSIKVAPKNIQKNAPHEKKNPSLDSFGESNSSHVAPPSSAMVGSSAKNNLSSSGQVETPAVPDQSDDALVDTFDIYSGGRVFSLGLKPEDIFQPNYDEFSIAQLDALEQFFHNGLARIKMTRAILQKHAELIQLQEQQEILQEILSTQ